MNISRSYSFKVPGCINSVGSATDTVMRYVDRLYGTLNESVLFELRVILNELILNAVKHGNCEDQNKCVHITAGVSKHNKFFLRVKDEGNGFDCKCMNQQKSNVPIDSEVFYLKESGRGIVIVRNLCDKVYYSKKGNTVLVIKNIDCCNCKV